MKYIKNTASALLAVCLTLALCAPVSAVTYKVNAEVGAKAYYLYNIDADQMIDERNMNERMYPASLTKIMTAIIAIENTSNLDTVKCTYPNYVQDFLYDYQWVQKNGAVSLGGLNAGEELTMRQLLYACLLPSANEAAMIIADHIGGSQEGFAEMMNRRAKELGAYSTNFVNANGLHDPNHYTTAYDMALISLHAMELPGFMDIVSATFYDSGPTNMRENVTWNTTIRMQVPTNDYYYPGLRGIKTGSVPEAGDCFISTCTKDGFTYLLVVMGSEYLDADGNALGYRGSFRDTASIYDDVFENLRRKTLIDKGSREDQVELRLSFEQDVLPLMAGERLTALVPKATESKDLSTKSEIPEFVKAPVKKGEYIGELCLYLGGEEIGRVSLLAAESVEASAILAIWDKITTMMSSFWFKFAAVLILLLVIAYVIIMILRNRNKRGGNYRPRRRI